MKNSKRILTGLALGGLLVGGCVKQKPAEPAMPTAVAAPTLKEADLTHVLVKEAVLYKSPAAGAAPVKTVKAGTKVLVLIPGSDSTQVELMDGTMGYVPTEALETAPPMPAPMKAVPEVKIPGKPGTVPAMPTVPAPATMPAVVTPPPPAPKETHVLSKEQPFFTALPAADAKPAGMLPAGTKVLLVIPGSEYAQVETDGKLVFTPTDGLESIAK